ncbi:alanine racemase [Marinicrinis lubricantis]|uniref:Alanine racemase n=1 Tax=Marinicrinis lubricantis TaxID=2086470 RepID=A0ABW1IKN0_9BACL
MDSIYRPTRVEISLDALRHNITEFRNILPASLKMMAVVKANAYGHGAVEIARELEMLSVDYLGVAILDEALELRKAGIRKPILVLGYTPPEGIEPARQEDITLTVYDRNVLAAMKRSSHRKTLKIHVKIDSGMGRIGITDQEEALRFIEEVLQLNNVEVEGIFTHYACADEKDKRFTLMQHERFKGIVDAVQRSMDHRFTWIHAGNSAAAIDTPELSFNMVRLGISMYGLYPSTEVERQHIQLQPVMSFKTGVVMVKQLPAGTPISYGATYRTSGDEVIATLPVGYGDGFSRLLSHKAHVLIQGQKVPVVGTICMDQCMANVTEIEDVRIGCEAVIFGRQGDQMLPVEELADALGTINYEITCMVSNRVPRVYVKHGQVVEIINQLLH